MKVVTNNTIKLSEIIETCTLDTGPKNLNDVWNYKPRNEKDYTRS